MSRKKCSICANPQAMEINSALEGGVQQKRIAQQYGVSPYALSRHKARCAAPAPSANGGTTLSDRIETWLRRADDLYLAAGVNGDIKSQVAALSAAVRSLQAEQRNEAKRQEQAESDMLPNGEHLITVERLDAAVKAYLESNPPEQPVNPPELELLPLRERN